MAHTADGGNRARLSSLRHTRVDGGLAALVGAYILFFALIGSVVAWLALTAETPKPPAAQPAHQAESEQSETPGAEAQASPIEEARETQTPAPEQPSLAEETAAAPALPALTGRLPREAFSQAFENADNGPRIAIAVISLGLSAARTEAVIDTLPSGVTLALSAYARDARRWTERAFAKGHEVLLQIPMEPLRYPENDPGPDTLLTTLTPQQNLERLERVLDRFEGYVGVINHMGSKFTASSSAMTPILQAIGEKGLVFVDSRDSQYSVAAKIARSLEVPRAVNNRYIDNSLSAEAIDAELKELEKTAQAYGAALGLAHPYPLSIDRIAAWAPTLAAKGIALAPVSAIVNRQPIR